MLQEGVMRHVRDLCLLMLSALPASLALAANPELLAYEQGIEDPGQRSEALRLSDLSLELDVVGALADVTLTARFANPSDETLEGIFNFELPDGAVVTGYALDIEGRMVDGVLVEALKAQRSYEAEVREGIDPGLATVSRANVFTTRVFPIPEEGERTIRLRFSAPIHAVRGLEFPLETDDPVGQFRVTLNSAAQSSPPQVSLPGKTPMRWQEPRQVGRSSAARYGQELSGKLRIASVKPRSPALASVHANGERRVHILDGVARIEAGRDTGGRLRVYWDRSRSRRDQDTAAERRLLARHLARAKPAAIDLVLFNSSGATVRRVTAGELDAALGAVTYRGGTSFAVLAGLEAPAADQCLVFTDGVVTIDARPEFTPGCEVFALTSAADADRGYLQRLAGGNSAAVLRVGVQEEDEILRRLRGSGPRVVRAFTHDGRSLDFAALDGGERGWSVVTDAPGTGEIVLQIAGTRGAVIQRRYSPVTARRASFDAAGALWAAHGMAKLSAEDGAQAAFVALSRKFSVASTRMSFLVLETAQQYVDADIEPPGNFPKEWLAEFRGLRAERDREQREAREERIEEVLEAWREVVEWWKRDFDPRAKKPARIAAPQTPPQVAAAPTLRREAPGVAEAIQAEDIGAYSGTLDEVMVTGARGSLNAFLEMRRLASEPKTIEVELADWRPDRPYISALDAARADQVERIIAAQEREFGASPAFYFDVAEWLRRHGREAGAEEMLLSALELPVANQETSAMVAERLQRYASLDRAVWLLERAADQTDYLPQPRRALALALAARAGRAGHARARADLERAVALLNEVIMNPWEGSYDGIEVVSLMEVNALLPRARAAGVRKLPLDERLRALLDVDLRVVIEWNTGATDMDLWVDEPNGERAIYSNPLTGIGGRLSNDMTEGYGPEEYLLRRAATGEYRISVNVYSADAINPNGTTVVTARLYRDWGRATQKETTMEIELAPDDKGEKFIGTFKVQ
jgi:hypothetical protein